MLWINKKWNKTGWFYYIWSQSESEKVNELIKKQNRKWERKTYTGSAWKTECICSEGGTLIPPV